MALLHQIVSRMVDGSIESHPGFGGTRRLGTDPMQEKSTTADESSERPPVAVEVARRACILSAVVCRASIETYADEVYKQQTADDIREWLDELKLWPHLEPDEERLLRAPLGALSPRLQVRGTWFTEGLAVLAWALKRGEFPPHDCKVDPIAVTNALDFLHPMPGNSLPRHLCATRRNW